MAMWIKKLLPAMGAAALLSMAVNSAPAATITESYFQTNGTSSSGQLASNSAFTTGTSNVNLNVASPVVNMTVGQFFRFGVGLTVTNNANPAAGGDWDTANQNVNGNPAQPTDLGMSVIAFKVGNSDSAGTSLTPLSNPGTPPRSKATINNTMTFAVTDSGDVNGGNVGNAFQIGAGNASVNVNSATGVAQLAYFALSQAKYFTGLAYQANAAGDFTLTPVLDLTASSYWTNTSPGTIDGDGNTVSNATYLATAIGGGDVLVTLPAITIHVTGVPEPTTIGMAGLSMLGFLARRRRA